MASSEREWTVAASASEWTWLRERLHRSWLHWRPLAATSRRLHHSLAPAATEMQAKHSLAAFGSRPKLTLSHES